MAAVSAARHPRFSTFYKAMRERGKPAKLAFVALARKLIVMLNAILRDRVAIMQHREQHSCRLDGRGDIRGATPIPIDRTMV
jgi:hypothetical protein